MPRRKEEGVKYFLTRERAPIYTTHDDEIIVDKTAVREMARILGAIGGRASKGKTSAKKAKSSRANGKLGGRPKGSKHKPLLSMKHGDVVVNKEAMFVKVKKAGK